METQFNTKTTASSPNDKSLEAYLAWIMIQRSSHETTETKFTEAELAAAWREYWQEGSNY